MTAKEFTYRVSNSKRDFLQEFLGVLEQNKIQYCVIGGLAVNAYAEPLVSLDLDVIIAAQEFEQLLRVLPEEYSVKKEKHSVNISSPTSDFRIQLQTDSRYQNFIERAASKSVLGYEVRVAALEDVLQGKLWAYNDPERRASKRQKDLADIMRLLESNPEVLSTSVGKIAKQVVSKL